MIAKVKTILIGTVHKHFNWVRGDIFIDIFGLLPSSALLYCLPVGLQTDVCVYTVKSFR